MDEKEILDIKFNYEKRFNELFFSKDFKEKMVKEFSYCPQGLTFEPRFDKESEEWSFCACCKEYNYDFYSYEVGDYTILKKEIKEEWAKFMIKYVRENDEKLANEIKNKVYYV